MIENPVGQRIAMLRSWRSQSVKIEDDGIRGGYEATVDEAIEQLSVMEKAVDAIVRNKTLSEHGQALQLADLAAATLKDLKELFSKADGAEDAYTRLHAVSFAPPDPPKGFSELGLLLREQEIRTSIRSLLEPERVRAYHLALERGDFETALAIRRAPGQPLIPVEMREKIDREYLEQNKPKEFLRLQSLDALRTQLRAIATMLQSWLGSYEQKVTR